MSLYEVKFNVEMESMGFASLAKKLNPVVTEICNGWGLSIKSVVEADKIQKAVLQANVEKSFSNYKENILQRNKEDIFNLSFKNSVISDFYDYLRAFAGDYLSVKEIGVLVGLEDNILEELYEIYVESTDYRAETYDDITEMLKAYCKHIIETGEE